MASREDIISKIRNLLNKSTDNGASAAEATQAALIAQQLIAKYDIEDSELYETTTFEVVEVSGTPSYRKFKYTLGTIIADNYRCRVYFTKVGRKHKPVFMGRNLDANAAALVYNRLYDCVNEYANSKSKQYRGMGMGLYGDYYNSAAVAFMDGIRMELEKQCHELMLARPAEVDQEFEEKTAGWGHTDARLFTIHSTDYDAGVAAGRDAVRTGRLGQDSIKKIGK